MPLLCVVGVSADGGLPRVDAAPAQRALNAPSLETRRDDQPDEEGQKEG